MQRKTNFQMFFNTANVRVEASCRLVHILSNAGKLYSDSELVNQCLVETVKSIHPDKEGDFVAIPLSCDTVQCQQCTIAEQQKQSLLTKVRNSKTILFGH